MENPFTLLLDRLNSLSRFLRITWVPLDFLFSIFVYTSRSTRPTASPTLPLTVHSVRPGPVCLPHLHGGRPLRTLPLNTLLVAVPVDGGDGRQALQLQVALVEVPCLHFELQAQGRDLQAILPGGGYSWTSQERSLSLYIGADVIVKLAFVFSFFFGKPSIHLSISKKWETKVMLLEKENENEL